MDKFHEKIELPYRTIFLYVNTRGQAVFLSITYANKNMTFVRISEQIVAEYTHKCRAIDH